MSQNSVVIMFFASVIAIGLGIIIADKLFNPINDLATAEALRPTLINIDLAALDAILQDGNSGLTGKEYLAQIPHVLFDAETISEAASKNQVRLSSEEERSQPNTRIAGTNIPPFVNEECQYPIQKALDLERVLGKSSDPQNSIWLTEYCNYREQMWAKQCYVPNDYLYYGELCRE